MSRSPYWVPGDHDIGLSAPRMGGGNGLPACIRPATSSGRGQLVTIRPMAAPTPSRSKVSNVRWVRPTQNPQPQAATQNGVSPYADPVAAAGSRRTPDRQASRTTRGPGPQIASPCNGKPAWRYDGRAGRARHCCPLHLLPRRADQLARHRVHAGLLIRRPAGSGLASCPLSVCTLCRPRWYVVPRFRISRNISGVPARPPRFPPAVSATPSSHAPNATAAI